MPSAIALSAALLAAGLPGASAQISIPAPVEQRIAAPEAHQGVASDERHVYAVDDSRIGKYRIADGARVGGWQGDPARFPHLNSCTLARGELACATSNYPATPHASRVEFFDPRRMRHLRGHDFGLTDGSLTAIDWHAGHWWATFAHYDGKGGMPGKDAAQTRLVKLDRRFRVRGQWTFPPEVVALMRPHSASGASWTGAGLLAVSGHDRPEIYLLALPQNGTMLRLEAIVLVATHGQALDRDPCRPGRIWTIARASRELVLSDLSATLPALRIPRPAQAARRCSSNSSTTP